MPQPPPSPPASPGARDPHRWVIVALLRASTTINYIDRQTLSALGPVLSREFDLTPVDYS